MEEEKYIITERGREDGITTADTIAFTVRQKAEKLINRFNRKKAEVPAAPAPEPEPSNEEKLLGEIRDLLKEKK